MTEHNGHRRRICEKLERGAKLEEHELLEILLFNALPRVNTNPIAHALIKEFGSLKGVLEAPMEKLLKVPGVGKSCALYLMTVGACASAAFKEGDEVYLKSYGDFKSFAAARLKDRREEVLEFYFCEKNGKLKKVCSITDNNSHSVAFETQKLYSLLAEASAYGAVVAHNHLTGGSAPSEADDRFTCKVQLLCSANGIVLLDHCIVADEGIYSYFSSGRIDEIKVKYSFDNLID